MKQSHVSPLFKGCALIARAFLRSFAYGFLFVLTWIAFLSRRRFVVNVSPFGNLGNRLFLVAGTRPVLRHARFAGDLVAGYVGRPILQHACFNNSRSLHFFLAAWPVVGIWFTSLGVSTMAFNLNGFNFNRSNLDAKGKVIPIWADVIKRANLGMEVMHERYAYNLPLDLAATTATPRGSDGCVHRLSGCCDPSTSALPLPGTSGCQPLCSGATPAAIM